MLRIRLFLVFIVGCLAFISPVEAAYSLSQGRLISADEVATMSAEDHYAAGLTALEKEDWPEVVRQFRIIVVNFPKFVHVKESLYYLGVGYYYIGDFDFANQEFTQYLKVAGTSKHFEDVLKYKYAIAEQFKAGAKKHIFGSAKLPKWMPADQDAIEIFDEIAVALPGSDLAAKALLAKAELLDSLGDYDDSADAYQDVINRFPRTPFAVQGYVALAKLYLKEGTVESQNPDLLALARINLKRFQAEFPGDQQNTEVDKYYQELRELYANGLYETGQFYERLGKPWASVIYYLSAAKRFPNTDIAKRCQQRLDQLKEFAKKIDLNIEETR